MMSPPSLPVHCRRHGECDRGDLVSSKRKISVLSSESVSSPLSSLLIIGRPNNTGMGERLPANLSWLIPDVVAGWGLGSFNSFRRSGDNSPDQPLIWGPATQCYQQPSDEEPAGASRSHLAGVVDQIQREIASRGRVAVHCQGGNGRTRLRHTVCQHLCQGGDQPCEGLQAAVHRTQQTSGKFENIWKYSLAQF